MSPMVETAGDTSGRLSMRSGPQAEILFSGARILDPRAGQNGPADLLVREGRIASIAPAGTIEAPDGTETVDATGKHIFPGFTDPHVHLRTPGREDEEDLDSGSRAAAAGGFCMVVAMPNTDPVIDTATALGAVREDAARQARIPIGFLAAVTRDQEGETLTEMAELQERGALGFTDDGRPVSSARMVRRAFQYQRLSGGVLALHEEMPDLSGDGVMHEGEVAALVGMSGIPSISESTAIARDAAIARYEEGRLHVLHVSARESVDVLRGEKERGTRLTAEVTPHHLVLTDQAVRSLDPRFKMNPPLRSEEDQQALLDALRSGIIDCIATDHAPHAPEEKEDPFEAAPMGVTGLETAFPVLYTDLVIPGVIELGLLVERMTAGAEIYGLTTPTVIPEQPANLCMIDLDAEWTVGESGYESRSSNSSFSGRNLRGRVLMTLAAGREAYRERGFAIHPAGGGR